MGKEVVIRKAGTDEITTVIDLAGAIWPPTYKDILSTAQIGYMMRLFYSESSLAEQFKKHTFVIAYLGDDPVAFASYALSSQDKTYRLHKIYVDRSVQGKGLGKALISYVLEALKCAGGIALELNVNRNNTAMMFYEKLGFKVIREEDIDIGSNYWMNDYVMRLEI